MRARGGARGIDSSALLRYIPYQGIVEAEEVAAA